MIWGYKLRNCGFVLRHTEVCYYLCISPFIFWLFSVYVPSSCLEPEKSLSDACPNLTFLSLSHTADYPRRLRWPFWCRADRWCSDNNWKSCNWKRWLHGAIWGSEDDGRWRSTLIISISTSVVSLCHLHTVFSMLWLHIVPCSEKDVSPFKCLLFFAFCHICISDHQTIKKRLFKPPYVKKNKKRKITHSRWFLSIKKWHTISTFIQATQTLNFYFKCYSGLLCEHIFESEMHSWSNIGRLTSLWRFTAVTFFVHLWIVVLTVIC